MELAARTGAWAKFGYTAKDYVQDGLIAMWDGIENAGWGVHDPNATEWKDLIGSNTATLTSNASFSAESLDWVSGSGRLAYAQYIAPSTVKQFEVTAFSHSDKATIFFQNGNRATDQINCAYQNGYIRSTYPGIQFVQSQIDKLQVSCQLDSKMYYKEGVSQTTTNYSSTWGNDGGSLNIGGRPSGAFILEGGIYSLRIYDRELSEAEIIANYAVDKARFGLT